MIPNSPSETPSHDNGKPLGYPPDIRDDGDQHDKNDIDNPEEVPTEIEQDIPPQTPTKKNPPQQLPGKDDLGGTKREV